MALPFTDIVILAASLSSQPASSQSSDAKPDESDLSCSKKPETTSPRGIKYFRTAREEVTVDESLAPLSKAEAAAAERSPVLTVEAM